jgi:hypothetical protein
MSVDWDGGLAASNAAAASTHTTRPAVHEPAFFASLAFAERAGFFERMSILFG